MTGREGSTADEVIVCGAHKSGVFFFCADVGCRKGAVQTKGHEAEDGLAVLDALTVADLNVTAQGGGNADELFDFADRSENDLQFLHKFLQSSVHSGRFSV